VAGCCECGDELSGSSVVKFVGFNVYYNNVSLFVFFSVSRPSLRPTQPPVQWVPGVLSPGLKGGRVVTLTTNPIWCRGAAVFDPLRHVHNTLTARTSQKSFFDYSTKQSMPHNLGSPFCETPRKLKRTMPTFYLHQM
jgi:hypothetical protein